MSKFCGNCGNMLNDADTVCGRCGTEFSEPAGNNGYDPYAGYETPADKPEKKESSGFSVNKIIGLIKKNIPAAAGVLAAVLVLIVIICAAASGGYKKTIKNYFKAMYKDDYETVANLTSVISTNGDDVSSDSYQWAVDIASATFESKYGEFRSVKVKVTDVTKYKKDEIESYCQNYCSGVDSGDIKKLYEVKVELTLKGKDSKTDKDNPTNSTILISKEKGGWKIASENTF